MESCSIAFSDDGTLIEPKLHDAELFGIISLPNRRVIVLARDIEGKTHCLALVGVERFRANDFKEGNIILDITADTPEVVSREDIAYTHDLDPSTDIDYLDKAMGKICRDNLILVRLDTSYGCSFLCICERVEIVKNWLTEVASICS